MTPRNSDNGKIQIQVAIIAAAAVIIAALIPILIHLNQPGQNSKNTSLKTQKAAIQNKQITLNGIVKDELTNEPITNATILISQKNVNTTSDSNGEFQFKADSGTDDSFDIRVSHKGYITSDQSYSINGDITILLKKNQ